MKMNFLCLLLLLEKQKNMENFLTSLKLQEYLDAFEEQGFDDFESLKTLSEDQLELCLVAVGMTKIGHKMRIKNGLQAANLAPTSPEPAATPSTTTTSSHTPTSCTPTTYPANVRTLYVPNEISNQIKLYNSVLKEIYETAYDSLHNVQQFRDYTRSHLCAVLIYDMESLNL